MPSKSKTACMLVLAQIVSTFGFPCFSWNAFGHETVACIAYRKLTPETKERANALLKLNPYYRVWLDRIPSSASPADRDMMIFALASTWPDEIKHDGQYKSDGSNGGNKPDGPACAENIGYSDLRKNMYWHFVDQPFSTDHTKLPPCSEPNIQTEIEVMRAAIASDAPDDLKSYDLTWLIHLVGDLHQPLHCVSRITKGDPEGDKGGNDVKLTGPRGGTSNLHSLWDGALGDDRHVEAAVAYAQTLPDANAKLAKKMKSKDWLAESFKLCKSKVYRSPIGKNIGPFTVTDRYKTMVDSVTKQQAELAGARLANLLNTELK